MYKFLVIPFIIGSTLSGACQGAGSFGGLVVPNHGQVKNGFSVGATRWVAPPSFYMDAPWGRLYVTDHGLLADIILPEERETNESGPPLSGLEGGGALTHRMDTPGFGRPTPRPLRHKALLLDLPGTNWREVIPEEEQVTKLNFFYGNDPNGWVTNVPTYGRLRIHNLFPGTDLILDPQSADFWCMEGSQAVMLSELEAQLPQPDIGIMIAPIMKTYYDANVALSFEQSPQNAPFPRTSKMAAHPDQALLWGTYVGGSFSDEVAALAVDGSGHIIAAGSTQAYDFPTLDGYDATFNGYSDIFVVKLTPDGRHLLWGTFVGGTKDEMTRAIALDAEANVVVCGVTGSTDIPTTPEAFDTTYNGGTSGTGYITGDIYAAKLSSHGDTLLWGTYIGGKEDDQVWACAVDRQGRVIIAGGTHSNDMPTAGGLASQLNGGSDIYLARLSGDGRTLLWGTYLGGSKREAAFDVALDQGGNLVIAGGTSSPDMPVPGGFDTTLDGEISAGYIAKISIEENAVVWGTYLEGTQGLLTFYGGAECVTIDEAGDVYVLGQSDVADMPVPGGFDTTFNGNVDIYLAKLSSDGSRLLWGSYLGGVSDDFGVSIAVNGDGDVIVLGYTHSHDLPCPNGYSTLSGNGLYLARIAGTGERVQWGTYLGGWGNDYPYALALDGAGDILVGGTTESPDFPVPNGYDQTYNSSWDGMIAKITDYAGPGRRLFVPAAAHTPGAYGTRWRTDGMILNPNGEETCYDLIYRPSAPSGGDIVCEHRCLAPDAAWSYEDIIASACGQTGASAGALRVEPDGPLKMSTRTYTERGDGGTYGQFVPAQTRGEAIGVGETGHLIVLKQNGDYRTNIGFSEITGQETEVAFRIYDGSGSELLNSSFFLPPYAWRQVSLIELGILSIALGRAEIKTTAGGAVLAYASLVDNRTGDAIFTPVQKDTGGAAAGVQLIPAAAHTPGAYGTQWQSDLWLYNAWFQNIAEVNVDYYTNSGKFSRSIFLAPQEQIEIQDIVTQLFPETGNGSGNLRFYNAWQVLANSRTYNFTSDGTYGQFIPAKPDGQMLPLGFDGRLLQIACGADYRTNVGFADFLGKETALLLEIRDLDGALLGSQTLTIPPRQTVQINDVFATLGISCPSEATYARIMLLSGSRGYAYASVVDNRTGDAIFIPISK